jgi:hypothetical protein
MEKFIYQSSGYLSYGNHNVYDLFDIPHEYELIRIKWNDNGSVGYMDLCPPALFETPGCVGRFKKLIKLSVMSDLTTDTQTIKKWRQAVKAEYDFCFRLITLVCDKYSAEMKSAKSEKEHIRTTAKFCRFVKKLNSLKKRVEKVDGIIEETALKYQID